MDKQQCYQHISCKVQDLELSNIFVIQYIKANIHPWYWVSYLRCYGPQPEFQCILEDENEQFSIYRFP
jgi:hypothetical protein